MATSKPEILLTVKNLEVVYHDVVMAIQGVSFDIPGNSIVAVLGVNGAGKTTTLKAISGFLTSDNAKITDGTIEFGGKRISGKDPYKISRQGVILIPERDKIFITLTVEENLRACLASGRDRARMLDQVIGYFPVLKKTWRKIAGYLSGGERQMLAMAQGLLSSPKLLMVDELSFGLAPIIVNELMEILSHLRRDMGLTILVVEQNATAALKIADYGYIMENGRIVYKGTTQELSAHEDVREFYLGLGEKTIKSYRDVKQYRRIRRWWG